MSTLRDRILYGQMADYEVDDRRITKANTVVGLNYAVTDIPLTRIQIAPGVIMYDEMQPLITSDGAPVSATQPGSWGQLFMAGRRR